MNIQLNVQDRFLLPELLPQQGGKIEMLSAQSIVRKIEFTADEIADFHLKDNSGSVTWTNGKDVEFDFTPEQIEILKAASKRADKERKITQQNLSLIEKIDSM